MAIIGGIPHFQTYPYWDILSGILSGSIFGDSLWLWSGGGAGKGGRGGGGRPADIESNKPHLTGGQIALSIFAMKQGVVYYLVFGDKLDHQPFSTSSWRVFFCRLTWLHSWRQPRSQVQTRTRPPRMVEHHSSSRLRVTIPRWR